MKHTPENVPIIIPCSHRPEFLKQCLDYLKQCDNIEKFNVYFSYDNSDDHEGIGDWDGVYFLCEEWKNSNISRNTFILERKDVWNGSLNSTGSIGYVMNIIGATGGFIYIEEDVLVSKCFLNFCLDSLNFYDENKYVMMIAGHSNRPKLPETKLPTKVSLFNKYSCSVLLGMASWRNRWKWIDSNLENFCYNPISIKEDLFNNTVLPEITGHIDANGTMRNKAGGGLITACMIKDGRICLVPNNDLSDHIGWYGWHIPKNTADPNNPVAKSETFHQENTYDSNFPIISKKDVAKCFNVDINKFKDSRSLT